MTPKRFFRDRVTPAQWWVFILAKETIQSTCFRVSGKVRVRMEVAPNLLATG